MLISLPNTGSTDRNRSIYCMRRIAFVAVWIFLMLKLRSFFFEPIYSVNAMRSVALHNAPTISQQITKYNAAKLVLNEDLFGPLKNDSVVIVVQVHTRVTYLSYLIGSLAQAYGISTVLLIFSHDYHDKDIKKLVETIDFCLVMQIFYPYPIHKHPKCLQNTLKSPAMRDKCNKTEFPYHNNQRSRAQMKHHWWWKANFIFDQSEITRYHSGLVLFLEEDYYVTKDFLYILKMMYKRTIDLCPQCNIYTLGRHGQRTPSPKRYAQVNVMPWTTANNMAFAFNRATWNNIRTCAEHFCSFGDYNYDQSLEHMSRECPEGELINFSVKQTRVFHTGACSTHMTPCKQEELMSQVQNALYTANKSSGMFPRNLKLTGTTLKYRKTFYKPLRGWDTNSDKKLCMSMISSTRIISAKRAKVK
ncbi:alpha-1,6-mannosyl-glycoprotein 2-beta-N-acetylglucosaminyltransferase-like isoform 3-T4 [Glossina fuscipes fuscipes]